MSDNPVPSGRIRRTMPLAGFTARAAGGRLVAGLREKAGDTGAVERFHEQTAERYTELLGHSKGVLMKAGQLLSMVDTNSLGIGTLSPYQSALARLQADAPPMAASLARDTLERELGRSVDDVFAHFTEDPIAAASIGQVHRAVLHDGREVAVKIQYPGAEQSIRDDLANTEMLSTFFRFFATASGSATPDIRQVTSEIATRIAEEIDYRHEAANITAFSELYRDHPFIRIPEVIPEASTGRVLTMTYLHGMNWAAAQYADQHLKDTWIEVIWRFVAGSYRHSNLFHADPHPGNYCFGPDGTVGFVDFGCTKSLPEHVRSRFVATARAVVEGHKDRVHELMAELGFFDSGSALTVDETYQWWKPMMNDLLVPQPVTFSPEGARQGMRAILDIRDGDHPVRRMSLPGDLAFFSRINLSVNAICAQLGATVHMRSVLDDLDGIGKPMTPLGKQHVAWVRDRGLPFGLENHDAVGAKI